MILTNIEIRNMSDYELNKTALELCESLDVIEPEIERREQAEREHVREKEKEDRLQARKNIFGDRGCYKFGHFLKTVADFAIYKKSGGAEKRDFTILLIMQEIERRASGVNESIGSEGAFLVPTVFSNEIFNRVYSSSLILPKCRGTELPGKQISIPCMDEVSRENGKRHGGLLAYWVSEGVDSSGKYSKPTLMKMNLDKKKMLVILAVTSETAADANLLQMLKAPVADEIGFRIQDSVINGSGAGQPLGILKSPCLITVSKEGSQSAGTIIDENVIGMMDNVWNKNACEWYCNDEILKQLLILGALANGEPYFRQTPGGDFLLGRRVNYIEQCAQLGNLGDLILADWSQYQVFSTKLSLSVSAEVPSAWVTDEIILKFRIRIDGLPCWKQSVKPYHNSNADARRSPFIALEART